MRLQRGAKRAILGLALLLVIWPAAADEWRTAAEAFTQDVAVPADAGGMAIWLRTGPDGLTVTLRGSDNAANKLTIRPFTASVPAATAGQEPTPLPDAGFEIPELKLKRFVRPNPAMLKPPGRDEVLKNWTQLPSPLQRPLALAFRSGEDGVTCYVDGNYAGKVLPSERLAALQFVINPGSALGPSRPLSPVDPGFHPLDLPEYEPGRNVRLALEDTPVMGRVPFGAMRSAGLDLGLTARHQALYSNYTYRGALDGLPDSFLFTVPGAQYTRAWVLCSIPDGATQDRALTARLTRFVSGGPYTGRARDCLADTTVVLPDQGQTPPPGVTRVGAIHDAQHPGTLYLVEVPLGASDIQDLIFTERKPQRGTYALGPYLDFELLGRLRPQDRPHPFNDDRFFPDSRRPSAVRVHAVTLEQTPVEMEVRQTQPGNVFCGSEKPELHVALRPRVSGAYELRWAVRDVAGKPCGEGSKRLTLPADEAEQVIAISLVQPRLGWYAIEVSLLQGDRTLLTHHASFALLAADTRQAGYESPYASWWFDHHYGTSDPQIAGPLLLKAGFRRAAYAPARHTEAALAPWKTTTAAVSWGSISDPKLTDEQIEANIQKTLTAYPHCDNILLFHESLPGAPLGTRTAPELFGLPVKEYPGSDARWEHVTRLARIVRAKFPQLKIFIGNSGAASELIAEGLRRGFHSEHADYIGVETVGRTGHPEKLWEGGLPGVWLLREIARQKGYDWGVTSCYECNYRQERLLGDRRQAEWYVRDALLSHAYRFPYISIALLYDAGNSYHGSFWGSTGLCRRYPLLYPKQSYVAMAVLTQVLDRVTLRREVPTGSNCVYALDFARADGMNVTPVWTARGTCTLTLSFKNAARVEAIDLFGRSRAVPLSGGKATVTAGGAVQYLVTRGTLTGVTCGPRSYPEDQPPAAFRVADSMQDLARWQLVTDKDPLLEQTTAPHLPFRTAGRFAVRAVKDPEKGACVEMELLRDTSGDNPLLSQYGVLRLKSPVTLPGQPHTLGMWVKGNSGWGQVYWEIEDAAGVRRISCGTVVHDADVFDYDGRVSLNYDGWAFLSFPITEASPIPDLSTGAVVNLWEATERSKPVTYPLKLTGVAVAVPQQALHLTEMVPVKQIIRLKDVGAYE